MGRLPKKKSTKSNSSSGSTSSGGSSGSKKKDRKEQDVAYPPGDAVMMEEPTPPSTADVFRQINNNNSNGLVDVDVETQNNDVVVVNESPATNENTTPTGKSAEEKKLMVKRIAITILLIFCLAGIGTVIGLLAKAKPFTKDFVGDGSTQQQLPPGGGNDGGVTPPNYGGDGGTTPGGTTGGGANNNGGNTQGSPTSAPTSGAMIRIRNFVEDEVGINIDSNEPLKKATMWLSQDTEEPVYDSKLIQRFAVLAMDFALQGSYQPTDQTTMDFNNPVNRAGDEESQFVTDPIFAVHDVDECMWESVVCNDTIVTELHFARLGLSGTIPSSISLLPSITHIDLNTNNIHGTIPDTLYDLTNLNSLYFYKNQLSGSIPFAISKLSNLQNLWLNENAMTGPFPIGISSTESYIHPIRYLNLYKNQFAGTIPNNMRLRRLWYMDLGRNQFSGTIPADMGEKYVWMRHLHLDHNNLVGPIPTTLPDIGNDRLETLSLNDNQLTGIVPGGHEILNQMSQWNLRNNKFSGMDKEVCRLSVFQWGEMVEFDAECSYCECNDEVACGHC